MNYIDQIYRTFESYVTPTGVKVLSLVGFLYATTTALSALRSLSRTFLLFGHNLPQRYGPGSWAVVTGGAKGIGAAFAEKLAGLGFNLVLIDLDEIAIAATALTIESKYPKVQVKMITSNFANSFEEGFYDRLMKQVEGLDISILVNNVGILTSESSFHTTDEAAILRTLTVNTVPMTVLSRRIIPLMLKRTNRSAIINVSSTAGIVLMPHIPVYCATKFYVDALSRMIQEDVKEKIDVLALRPDAVSTTLTGLPKVRSYILSPENVASAMLGKIGRTSYAHGHWRHEIAGWLHLKPYFHKKLHDHFKQHVFVVPVSR